MAETWVFNDTLTKLTDGYHPYWDSPKFESGGEYWFHMNSTNEMDELFYYRVYVETAEEYSKRVYKEGNNRWESDKYKTVTFYETLPTGDFRRWVQANATMQGGVQP